jgi:hypothetical protein
MSDENPRLTMLLGWIRDDPGARTPNIPLLRKAVEWVEEQAALPEEERTWDQGVWRCDTAMCVAGYISDLEGWHIYRESSMSVRHPETGQIRSISHVARQALGLDEVASTALFVETIADERVIRDDGFEELNIDVQATARNVRIVAEAIAGERL